MFPETTVYFSMVIDRGSVSSEIVRGLRDGWRTINRSVSVTDERNVLSLCPVEDRTNLVDVRIRCVGGPLAHTSVCVRGPSMKCVREDRRLDIGRTVDWTSLSLTHTSV